MRIGLAQMNSKIGDFDGNLRKMLAFADAATAGNPKGVPGVARSGPEGPVELLVFPELSLCGYPPMDLLDQESFAEENLAALRRLQRELPRELAVAVGYVDRNRSGQGKGLVNAVGLLRGGELAFSQAKTLLPTYDVFDEARYFEPARERRLAEVSGSRIGFAICEDIWWEAPPVPGLRYQVDPVKDLLDAGAELLVVPSASPFSAGKLELRMRLSAKAAREGGVPLLYCNLLGGNDSLVFDGRSFALDAEGRTAALAGWEEELLVVDTDSLKRGAARPGDGPAISGWTAAPAEGADFGKDGTLPASIKEADKYGEIERALVLGIRDYMAKCGFKTACLGLSGGIDSALVAVLAAEAIGAGKVTCVSMPSRYSSAGSVSDSVALCDGLGMRLVSLPIEGPFSAFLSLLEPSFEGREQDIAEENLQARVRGSILMAWSNKFGSLLLTTGNKSELAAGYCTLYGDMCGGLAPIGDLLKTEVYGLAAYINARSGRAVIPEATLTKAPSAELRPNQTDQDSLPPYEVLDGILELYIIQNLGAAEIVRRGYESSLVERVVSMVGRAEHKRRQAAPVIKVSNRAFGTGRRMPIARAVYESDPRLG
jgi:NAD+ synthase (glutamine-hydrolysing)